LNYKRIITLEREQKFLSFNLGSNDKAVILLQQVTEVIQVSLAEICCIPQMPDSTLGIYNWRGEMLWLVDLEDMLGYAPLSQTSNVIAKMMAIVVQSEGKYLGLLVRHLMDIEWLNREQLKPPETQLFSSDILPFLEGYFISNSEELIIGLDAAAIVHAPMWAVHN
jgi:positive phototaxis protein PixI